MDGWSEVWRVFFLFITRRVFFFSRAGGRIIIRPLPYSSNRSLLNQEPAPPAVSLTVCPQYPHTMVRVRPCTDLPDDTLTDLRVQLYRQVRVDMYI